MTATPSIAVIEPLTADRARITHHGRSDAGGAPPDRAELVAELERVEPIISAALLAATAFRMRDHDALISALRMLVRVTRVFDEECQNCA